MRKKVATIGGILAVIGLAILGTTVVLTKYDAAPNSAGGKPSTGGTSPEEFSELETPGPAPPIVKMWIRQFYPQLGFVTLEGADNLTITQGSLLEVVKDGVVVAKFQVNSVEGNKAAAEILPDSFIEGRTVRAGDPIVLVRTVSVHADDRAQAPDRVSNGTVTQGGINSTWGIVMVDRIQGSPKNGDEAYLQRLGPEGGLMTIESVEGSRLVLNAGGKILRELRPGDRIQTRPTP